MASLLVGGTIYVSQKIKDKRAAKREAKRKRHEEWYRELEDEHNKTHRKSTDPLAKEQTGVSQGTEKTTSDGTRQSVDSRRSEDGPTRWVDEAILERRKSQSTV